MNDIPYTLTLIMADGTSKPYGFHLGTDRKLAEDIAREKLSMEGVCATVLHRKKWVAIFRHGEDLEETRKAESSRLKTCFVVGGGTFSHVLSHFSLAAPAFGGTARRLARLVQESDLFQMNVRLLLTQMAGGDATMCTNAHLAARAQSIADDPQARVVFFNAAVCDWEGRVSFRHAALPTGTERLDSKHTGYVTELIPASKILPIFRQLPNSAGKVRKDIFLVAFKMTTGATPQQQYEAGLNLLKENSCNLVLANDTRTMLNMVITPEEAVYYETTNRLEALEGLVQMAGYRSQLTFTQSTVVSGELVSWADPRIPDSLKAVVRHCIKGSAYKTFRGSTVGHFACKLDDNTFLTSIRKSNFNMIEAIGMVLVKTDGPDTVLAYGAKPSVGGQSQRMVFRDHPGFDVIVHFHSPLLPYHPDNIPVRSQREVECGSHQCGQNTSQGLKQFGNLKAVMLDNHGPNIVFPSSIDPAEVIDFINRNFDLSKKTGGYIPAAL